MGASMTYTVWVTILSSGKRVEDSRHDSLEDALADANVVLSGGVPIEITVTDSEGVEHFRRIPGNA
jgi:hypothetical protein